MRNRATTHLSKPRIRQSWSKYNLYNLSRFRNPPTGNKTFFQQKWAAKSVARAYHGEQVRESQWTRMFSRRIRSVVPMNPAQLAQDDGSQISAGRGSGLEKRPDGRKTATSPPRTPYMQMAFAPLERRLDVAIFRAMFASSTRQARQFVIHGAVTVNGKKMRYPGYLLNPGDLFQVDPERVMYATGAPKDRAERREGRLARKAAAEARKAQAEGSEEGQAAEETEAEKSDEESAAEEDTKEVKDPRETLKTMLSQAKTILSRDKDVLPAKRKQEIRGFQKAVRSVLSRSASSTVLTENLGAQFSELMKLLKVKKAQKQEEKKPEEKKEETKPEKMPEAKQAESSSSEPTKQSESTKAAASVEGVSDQLKEAFQKAAQDGVESLDEETTSELTDEELDVLKRALEQLRDNPIDSTKPYATPWRPRDYMSAFAFIPRYLEVNQNICAAVYIRHPVARPGVAEVPTPFGESVGTAAFAWYLRRR
ncbi:hypothetical protein VTN77DRAFT_3363 [Rasamsonia byssochlamydoides]|uniref:mitochondrial 37S ribosomal protein uS4m n=1 Tax=Rasamsonia byssochlamydoides TaxID=89139 RepID=UPI003742E075